MTAGWLPTGLRSSGGDGSGAGSMRASSNFVWRRLLRPAAAARPILPHPVGNELALLRSPSSSHAPMTEGGEAVRARCLLWVPTQHLGDADSAKCVHNEIQALWLTVRNIDPNMDDTVWYHSVRSRHWRSEPGTARRGRRSPTRRARSNISAIRSPLVAWRISIA